MTAIERRTLVRGAAWSAPVVLASSAIPAYAASPRSCQILAWPIGPTSTTKVLTNGTYTVTVNQVWNVGEPSRGEIPNPNMVVAKATEQVANGTANTGREGKAYTVENTTTTVLTLNQRSPQNARKGNASTAASQTLTFSITDAQGRPVTPANVSFNIYDVTASVAGTRDVNTYGDVVTLSGATWELSNFMGFPREGYTTVTDTQIAMLEQNMSPVNNVVAVTATITPTSPTFSITYSNGLVKSLARSTNNQYIGLGDITVC